METDLWISDLIWYQYSWQESKNHEIAPKLYPSISQNKFDFWQKPEDSRACPLQESEDVLTDDTRKARSILAADVWRMLVSLAIAQVRRQFGGINCIRCCRWNWRGIGFCFSRDYQSLSRGACWGKEYHVSPNCEVPQNRYQAAVKWRSCISFVLFFLVFFSYAFASLAVVK